MQANAEHSSWHVVRALNGSCCVTGPCGVLAEEDQTPMGEAPPTGTGPGTSSQPAPLLPISANTETSNDQDPGPPPQAFPVLPALGGGRRARRQSDIHQESAP